MLARSGADTTTRSGVRMLRKFTLAVLVGGAVMVPTAAEATFLPGHEPPVEYDCAASSVRANVQGLCTEHLTRTVASRIDLVGSAVVTSKGTSLGFTGDGTSTATATAATASARVDAALGQLKVVVEGAQSSVRAGCGDAGTWSGDGFAGAVHVDRLTVNGAVYTDLSAGTFTTPHGTVTVGATQRDYIDNSFDSSESQRTIAVRITSGRTTVDVASATVTVQGFPCRTGS